MSSVAERSPSWSPWEKRDHVRSSAVTVAVGGRWVVAACAFPQRSGDGGLGVALTNALLTWDNRRDRVQSNASGPGGADTPRGPDTTYSEVMP